MRPTLVLFAAVSAACASSASDANPLPDRNPTASAGSRCYALAFGQAPASDVTLPSLIELSREQAPGFVEPGRLAVREPGTDSPRAPISWWRERDGGELELVLGGGYTGYSFVVRPSGDGGWTGTGTYFADFGVEPTPPPLAIRLNPTRCP
jgi:hypothetical protein